MYIILLLKKKNPFYFQNIQHLSLPRLSCIMVTFFFVMYQFLNDNIVCVVVYQIITVDKKNVVYLTMHFISFVSILSGNEAI